MKNENNELAVAYSKKDEENRQIRDLAGDLERKAKKSGAHVKEINKVKKVVKEKEKELKLAK